MPFSLSADVHCDNMKSALVAAQRQLNEKVVAELVVKNTKKPLFGLFGPTSVNVLKLNLALDALKKSS